MVIFALCEYTGVHTNTEGCLMKGQVSGALLKWQSRQIRAGQVRGFQLQRRHFWNFGFVKRIMKEQIVYGIQIETVSVFRKGAI